MLYRYSEVFRTLLIALDLALVTGAWLGAYSIRFKDGDSGSPRRCHR